MKIVLATPLYPPDIAEPAPYVKELAIRLSARHSLVVLCYGSIPEVVPGVRVVAVKKSLPTLLRLALYTFRLLSAALSADVVYAQAGASVELPLWLVSLVTRTPTIFRTDNVTELSTASIRQWIRQRVRSRSAKMLSGIKLTKPEINPLKPRPDAALAEYETEWQKHLGVLDAEFAKLYEQ